MDINNQHNQSYWFVLREDQSNVIFSTNNFTIQNPQIAGQETRYIVDTGDNRYIQVNETPLTIQEAPAESSDKETTQPGKEEDNFWDRNKVKILLTLCLENRFKNANKDKTFWNEISALVGATSDECNKKYRNLRRTYIRLLKKKRLGKDIKWVHFNICEEVFKECKALPPSVLEPWEDSKVRRLLALYIENLHKFRDPEKLQKDVWKEIASQLDTTEYSCYHKFKNLKRTYFNWTERSRTGKLVKWPYHQYFERIFYNYNPSIGPWDRNKIKLLIDSYARIAYKFRNPKFQKKELWKEISTAVGESSSNCDRKFRNLKQTYFRLKMKVDSGGSITKWRYYKDFENIYNSSTLAYTNNIVGIQKNNCKEDDYVKDLLQFYVDNLDKFKDPLMKKKNVWKLISSKLGLSTEECDRKFRNLKQTYIRLSEKKRETGKCNKWPYYSYFEKIFDEPNTSGDYNHSNVDSISLTEIKKVIEDAQLTQDNDRFEKLIKVIQESNNIQRERNKILQALLDRK